MSMKKNTPQDKPLPLVEIEQVETTKKIAPVSNGSVVEKKEHPQAKEEDDLDKKLYDALKKDEDSDNDMQGSENTAVTEEESMISIDSEFPDLFEESDFYNFDDDDSDASVSIDDVINRNAKHAPLIKKRNQLVAKKVNAQKKRAHIPENPEFSKVHFASTLVVDPGNFSPPVYSKNQPSHDRNTTNNDSTLESDKKQAPPAETLKSSLKSPLSIAAGLYPPAHPPGENSTTTTTTTKATAAGSCISPTHSTLSNL